MPENAPSTGSLPLHGVIVLDFTRMLAGPYCSALLADLGADVIKVEPPHGDDQRVVGAVREGLSLNFELLNRSKRSIKLDLRHPQGRRIARELATRADVVLENFRPGVADRLGIGHADIAALNPDVVYCSISGYGQDGPLAASPSYDVVAQALSGLMSVTGSPDGDPTLVGDSVGDIMAGIYGALAAVVGLFRREASGGGTRADVAMFDGLFSLLPTALASWQSEGKTPQRVGNRHPLSAPFGIFAAKDASFALAVANPKLFAALCEVIGRAEWVEDARFATDQDRLVHHADLTAGIEEWSRARSAAQAVAALAAAGIPASEVWDVAQAATSDHVRHRALLEHVDHPVLGDLALPQQPVRFLDTAGDASTQQGPRVAPRLGEHSAEILREVLGTDEAEIQRLINEGVL